MGLLDGGDLDPLTGGLLNAAQVYGQSLQPSRLPINPMAGMLGAIGGFGQGYQGTRLENAKNALYGAEANKGLLANTGALDQLNLRRAEMGLPPLQMGGGGLLGGGLGGGGLGGGGNLGMQGSQDGSPGLNAALALPGKAGAAAGTGNLATMSREEAGRAATRYAMMGLDGLAQKYADYAVKGVEGGFENTPTGMREIAGGPQSQEQQIQKAMNALGFKQGQDGTWANDKGVVASQAEKEFALKMAGVPATNAAERFKTNEDIRSSFLKLGEVAPGGSLVAPGGQGGTARQTYVSPVPAPGTPENELNKRLGTTAGDLYDEAVKGVKSAAGQNGVYAKMLEQLDAGLKTGTGFDTRKYVADALTTLGADPTKIAGLPDSTQSTLFTNASRELLLERAKALGANPSNAEDKIILSSIASANNPTDAARALIQWKINKNNNLINYGEGMQKAVSGGQHPVDYSLKYMRDNPNFANPPAPGGVGARGPAPAWADPTAGVADGPGGVSLYYDKGFKTWMTEDRKPYNAGR